MLCGEKKSTVEVSIREFIPSDDLGISRNWMHFYDLGVCKLIIPSEKKQSTCKPP